MPAPHPTSSLPAVSSPTAALPPTTVASSHTPSPRRERPGGGRTTATRLLFLAMGLGAAYLVYKEIPQGRRYWRLDRM